MAIQMRRGNEVDFDATKMQPGEWAVSLDQKIVRMCFAPGVCIRMATYESFEQDMEAVRQILAECQTIQEAVERIQEEINQSVIDIETYVKTAEEGAAIATRAATQADQSAVNADQSANRATEQAEIAKNAASLSETNAQTSTEKAESAVVSAQNASQSEENAAKSAQTAEDKATEITGQSDIAKEAATEAKSYAHGGTGTRVDEDTDNARYYSEEARKSAEEASSIAQIDIMTIEKAGIGKPDGETITVDPDGTLHVVGGLGGTSDYESLENKPSIGGVELSGNKTLDELGVQPKGAYLTEETDPTVPLWAKEPQKPAYTANEVGADNAGSASQALANSKAYTDEKVSNLINGAPETLDTLKEVSEALAENDSTVEVLNQAIGNKLDKTGDSLNNIVTFTQATVRENVSSTEKHSILFGKIAKWFADLKTVAFSGSYNDLNNKPSIPTKTSQLTNDSGYLSTATILDTGEEIKANTEANKFAGAQGVKELFEDVNNSLMKTLWTNTNLSNTFAAQTVNVDLSEWKYIVIFYYNSYSNSSFNLNTKIFRVGTVGNIDGMGSSSNGVRTFKRLAQVNLDGVVFGHALTAVGTTADTQNNGYAIPESICGLKY